MFVYSLGADIEGRAWPCPAHWECACWAKEPFTPQHMPTNDYKCATNVDFSVTSSSQPVGEFSNMQSSNNEVQLCYPFIKKALEWQNQSRVEVENRMWDLLTTSVKVSQYFSSLGHSFLWFKWQSIKLKDIACEVCLNKTLHVWVMAWKSLSLHKRWPISSYPICYLFESKAFN